MEVAYYVLEDILMVYLLSSGCTICMLHLYNSAVL